jgi:hypothetical protein
MAALAVQVALAVDWIAVEVKERAVAGTGHGVEVKGGPALGMAVSALSGEVVAAGRGLPNVEVHGGAGRGGGRLVAPPPWRWQAGRALAVEVVAAGRDLPRVEVAAADPSGEEAEVDPGVEEAAADTGIKAQVGGGSAPAFERER